MFDTSSCAKEIGHLLESRENALGSMQIRYASASESQSLLLRRRRSFHFSQLSLSNSASRLRERQARGGDEPGLAAGRLGKYRADRRTARGTDGGTALHGRDAIRQRWRYRHGYRSRDNSLPLLSQRTLAHATAQTQEHFILFFFFYPVLCENVVRK